MVRKRRFYRPKLDSILHWRRSGPRPAGQHEGLNLTLAVYSIHASYLRLDYFLLYELVEVSRTLDLLYVEHVFQNLYFS